MSFLMPAPYLPITKVDFMLGRIVCHPFYQRRKKRSKASPVLNQFPNKIIFFFFFFFLFPAGCRGSLCPMSMSLRACTISSKLSVETFVS